MMEWVNQKDEVDWEDLGKVFVFTHADYCLVVGALAESISRLEETDLSLYEDGRLRLVASRLLLEALSSWA
jgi:hypothetical protein